MSETIQMGLMIAQGIIMTLKLLAGGIAIGFVLGTLIAIMRYQKIAGRVMNMVVSVIRGTPLILQLALVYFSFPGLLGIKLSILSAGILTFGLNSSAYIAEILRAGIESIPKGQFEAVRTLNIPQYFMWKDIILPQVVRNILPAMVNEVISLLKETALISTIGGMDIMRSAQVIAAEQYTYFLPLCLAGVYYYVLIFIIENIGHYIEKRGRYVKD